MSILNRSELQELLGLVFTLHPNRNVAECVLLDLYDKVELLASLQLARDKKREVRFSESYYKIVAARRSLVQVAAYVASEEWECDQENIMPRKHPVYRPTATDLLVRYIKALVWWAMERRVPYAATAIGCSLYTYPPSKIGELVVWAANNIRRVHSSTLARLQARFPALTLVTMGRRTHVDLRAPTPE